jgi:CheY-like chemotaxis protein
MHESRQVSEGNAGPFNLDYSSALAQPRKRSVRSSLVRLRRMSRRRVLVVEDNQDAGEMYRMLIELNGHEALIAENGVLGLEMLKTAHPDIALVDIGLPGMDGYEVARRFRAEPDGDRVLLVALTGYGSSADRDRSRQAGFDVHLLKPVDPDALKSLLDGAT